MDIHVGFPQSIPEQGLRGDLYRLADELMTDLILKKKN